MEGPSKTRASARIAGEGGVRLRSSPLGNAGVSMPNRVTRGGAAKAGTSGSQPRPHSGNVKSTRLPSPKGQSPKVVTPKAVSPKVAAVDDRSIADEEVSSENEHMIDVRVADTPLNLSVDRSGQSGASTWQGAGNGGGPSPSTSVAVTADAGKIRTAEGAAESSLAQDLSVQRKADEIVQAICGIVTSDNAKFTKSAAGQVLGLVTALRGLVAELGVVRATELGGSAQTSVAEVAPAVGVIGCPPPAGATRSYAEAARQPTKPRAKSVKIAANAKPIKARPEKKVVLVKSAPGAAALDSAALRRKLLETVKPRENGIRASVFNTKGGLMVVAEDEATRSKILAADVSSAGLVMSASQGEKPRVRIYDVPSHMGGKEVRDSVLAQNFEGADRDALRSEFEPLFRLGPKDQEATQWVCKVSGRVRDALLAKKGQKVFIDFNRCRVTDHVRVTHCYRCLGQGHVASRCQQAASTCRHCGVEGHLARACPSKDVPPRCLHCSHKKLKGDHRTGAKECPCLQMALRRKVDRTMYVDERPVSSANHG